jgi:hypothetical protein
MKNKIILGTLAILIIIFISITAFAYRNGSQMIFDQGQGKVILGGFGIAPDGFTVVFEQPFPNTNYSISLNGYSANINELWLKDDSANLGFGQLEKDCYVTSKKTSGFSAVCNWRVYQTSMAYNFKGEYANYWQLKNVYNPKGLQDTWDKVDWQISYKMQMVVR